MSPFDHHFLPQHLNGAPWEGVPFKCWQAHKDGPTWWWNRPQTEILACGEPLVTVLLPVFCVEHRTKDRDNGTTKIFVMEKGADSNLELNQC